MKLRSTLLLLPVIGGLSLGTLTPAQAATSDPITDVAASAVQTPGAHDRWNVTTSWTENGAARYSLVVSDAETGGVTYAAKAAAHSPASLTTDALIGDHDFWVRVQPEGGDPVAFSFHTPALDTTAPTGSYKLDRTSGYLAAGDPLADTPASADFAISQVEAAGFTSRVVVPGDGSPAKTWASENGFLLSYQKAGVFTPHVLLSDEFGNTRDVTLPVIHVLEDTVAPVVKITTPARPDRVGSWRVIRGTASDTGTGLALVLAIVMEKRGTIWWVYDFNKKDWEKGTTSRRETERKSKVIPVFIQPAASGSWRSPAIRHLQKGVLRVEAAAFDAELNIGIAKTVTHRIH